MRYIVLIFLACFQTVNAQENIPYRYEKDFPDAGFYSGRRSEFRSQMPDSSAAIIFSGPERTRSNDVNYTYHQAPDFYYLTGFTEANSVLLIFKDKIRIEDIITNEILFIPPVNKSKETWTGRMAGLDDAVHVSGIENCLLTIDLDKLPLSDSSFKAVWFGKFPSGLVDDRNDSLDLFSIVRTIRDKFIHTEAIDTYNAAHVLAGMREVKQSEELKLLKKAIAVSCEGHRQMMRAVKPGMTEFQVQAVGEYVFKSGGCEDVGYPSICGGGENSCILHYESNRRTLNDGDLILLDMGGEYHGYSADVTRTIPVNGRFSKEQKLIYDLVLLAHDSAMHACKPGVTFQTPHKAAIEILKSGLIKSGIIDKEEDFKRYFMHGTSHYLGLDVHDAGTYTLLKEGNVITIEPGIYIPPGSPCDPKWWNIGVRIEDDVLITSKGYENLSAACPVLTADIEKLMKEPFLLEKEGEK